MVLDIETYYFISPYGLGDTMILCGYREALKKRYGENIHFIIKPSHKAIMDMYEISDFTCMQFSREELFAIGANKIPQKGNYYVAHPEYLGLNNIITDFVNHKISFLSMYQRTLDIKDNAEFVYPLKYPVITAELKKKLSDTDMDNIAVIAPEMNATDPDDWVPSEVFQQEVDRLKEEGYLVIANLTSDKYQLTGCMKLDLTLDELVAVCINCGCVVSARSGLIDLIFRKAKNLTIIYPNQLFYGMYSISSVYGCIAGCKEIIHSKYSDRPLVTVITIVYNLLEANRKETFIRCLDSVHQQTYDRMEHLVIDGLSTDGTQQVLREYEERGWINLYSEKDNGIYDAMNKGIEKARGEIIVFLNSDDCFIDNEAVGLSIQAIKENNADFSYAKAVYIDGRNRKHYEIQQTKPNIKNAFFFMPFCHQTMFTRKDLLKKHKFNINHQSISDYEQFLALILGGAKPVFVDKELVEFRLGGMSSKLTNQNMIYQEKVEAYQNVLSEHIPEITFADCENIEMYKKIPDWIWHRVTNKIAFDIKQIFLTQFLPDTKDEEITESLVKVIKKNEMIIQSLVRFVYVKQLGLHLEEYFLKKNYKNIAVYGIKNIGERLLEELRYSQIHIKYAIDRNAEQICSDVDVVLPNSQLQEVDAIVVTAIFFFEEIKEDLSKRIKCPIISFDEVLDDVIS